MLMNHLILVMIILGSLLNSCGGRNVRNNDLSEIATTEIPDGVSSKDVYYFWIGGQKIHRGLCADPEFPVKETCIYRLISMPYTKFETLLDAGLTQTVKKLREKVGELRDVIMAIKTQIEILKDKIEQLEHDNTTSRERIRAAKKALKNLKKAVVGLSRDIDLVKEELESLDDDGLYAQAKEMARRLAKAKRKIKNLNTEIPTLTQTIQSIASQLEPTQIQMVELKSELTDYQHHLTVFEPQLFQAETDFASYQDTIAKLRRPFPYWVFAGEDDPLKPYWQHNRPFIRRFHRIFESHMEN